MKPRQQSNVRRSASLLIAVSFAMSLSAAHATSLTWDGADTVTSGAQGGAGTWNMNSTANWWNDTADVVWPNTDTDNDAIFANTAGTVTLDGGVTANDLTFSSTGYLIESNTLTLNGTTPTITTDPGVSATISSIVAGSAGLVKNGTGTLILSGAKNTYTGDTNVNAGTLVLQQQKNGGTITTASGAITEWKMTGDMDGNYVIQSAITFAGAGRVNKTGNSFLYAGINAGMIKVNQSAGALFDMQAGTLWEGGGSPGFITTNLGSLNVASGARIGLYYSNAAVDALTGSGTVANDGNNPNILTVGAANHTSSVDNPYFTGNSATFSGVLTNGGSGTLALIKTGSGTQVLSGINSYSGGTTVTGGTLKLDLSARSGEIANLGAFAISASANLEIRSGTNTGPDTTYFASGISFTGAGTIIKTGTGYVGLGPSAGGVKDFAGLIDIQQGILANHGTAWSTGAGAMDLNIAASAMFDMRSGNVKIDALSGAGTIGKSYSPNLDLSVGNNGGSATFSGVISQTIGGGSGTIALTKNGSGTQTLSGTLSYTGATTVNAGTLELLKPISFASNIAMGAANSPTLQLSSTLVADTWTLNKQITGGSGNAKIEKTGLGTVILTPSAGSSFTGTSTGALTVSGGKLYLTAALNTTTAPAVSVAAGALFGGTATVGNVTLANTGTLEGGMDGLGTLTAANLTIGSVVTDTATVKGTLSTTVGYKPLAVTNLTLNGGDNTVTLDATGTGLTNATSYDVLVSTNAISAPNASGGLAVNVFKSNSRAYTPNVDGSNKKVQLYYDAAATVYWTGAASSAWNPTATNWKLSGNNLATEFLANDVVFFHDSPVSSTVDISNGNVNPISTAFDNTTATAYTLQGGNGIATGSLAKSGGGMLTITNANSFGGGTTLSGGTLNLEHTSALGTGSVTVNGGTLNINNAAALGAGSLVIAGGTLNINNASTLGSGSLALNGGTLNISTAAALGSRTLALNGGTLDNTSGAAITLTTNNTQTWGGSMVFTGTKDLNLGIGAVSLTTSHNVSVTAGTLTVGGAISGSGPLTKSGAGTLILSGSNNYSGGTSVTAGTLKLDLTRGGEIASAGTIDIGATGNLEILSGINPNPDTTYFASGVTFTGAGTITKTGTGYLGVGPSAVGLRDFAGLIDIQQGTLGNHGPGWGSGAGAMDLNIAADAMLDMRSQNVKVDALSGAGTIGKSWAPDLNLSLGNNGGSATFSGVISQTTGGGTGSISLTKTGTGTQILSGASTYSGGTTVSNGKLLVNNATGSGTGSGAVTVSGGILGGTGSIAGAVTLNGGTLAPGASIESLTTGALTMNTGTTFAYEMNSTAGSYAADLLVVTSGVALNGTVQLGLTDVLGGAATRFADGTILTLINYATGLSGGFFYGTALGEGATFSAGLNTWKINYNAATGGLNFTGAITPGSHFINLTAIPEPGSLLALGCLVGSGMFLRSRRRK